MPESYLIFIKPPSVEELIKRLQLRKTETEQEVSRRIARARAEMALAKKYDYVVINDEVNRAATELADVVERVRKREKR